MPNDLDAAAQKAALPVKRRRVPGTPVLTKKPAKSARSGNQLMSSASVPSATAPKDTKNPRAKSRDSTSKSANVLPTLPANVDPNSSGVRRTRTSKSKRDPDAPIEGRADSLQDLLDAVGGNSSSSSRDMFQPFGMIFPSVSGRISKIVAGLSSQDSSVVMSSLEEFSEFMMMSSDDVAFRIPVDRIVPVLITLLSARESRGRGDNPQHRMLLSARILSVLLESAPIARDILARFPNRIKAVGDHIVNIEQIELSDQCVVIVSRLSQEYPLELIQAGVLKAVLTNLEFFGMSTQHQCVQIAQELLAVDTTELNGNLTTLGIGPVLTRLGELLSHPDSSIVTKISSCWRSAVDIWCHSVPVEPPQVRKGRKVSAEKQEAKSRFADPVIQLLVRTGRCNARLIEGLAMMASRCASVARSIASSSEFIDCTLKFLETDMQTASAALALYTSILPGLVRGEAPAHIELDSVRQNALSTNLVSGLGSKYNEPVSASVAKFSTLSSYAVQLYLVQLMLGIRMDETVLVGFLPVISDILGEYEPQSGGKDGNDLLVLATIRLVREIFTAPYPNITLLFKRHGIVDSINSIAFAHEEQAVVTTRASRRKSPPLSPVSASVWGPVIRAEAAFCIQAMGMDKLPRGPIIVPAMDATEFNQLISGMSGEEPAMTSHELAQSGLIKALDKFFLTSTTSVDLVSKNLVEVAGQYPHGIANLAVLVRSSAEREIRSLYTGTVLPDAATDALVVQFLNRPLRVMLTEKSEHSSARTEGGLLVLTEALTSVESLKGFLEKRGADPYAEELATIDQFSGIEDDDEFPFSDDFDEGFDDSDVSDAELMDADDDNGTLRTDVDLTHIGEDGVPPPARTSADCTPASGTNVVLTMNGVELDPRKSLLESIAATLAVDGTPPTKTPASLITPEIGDRLQITPAARSTLSTPKPSALFEQSPEHANPFASSPLLESIWGGSGHTLEYKKVHRESSAPSGLAPPPLSAGHCASSNEAIHRSLVHYMSSWKDQPDLISLRLFGCLSIILSGLSIGTSPVSTRISARASAYFSSPTHLATGRFPSWIGLVERLCPSILSPQANRDILVGRCLGVHRAMLPRLTASDKSSISTIRQKIRIKRENLIESAIVVMNIYGSVRQAPSPVLEIEFQGEEGTGSGPTNEFYANVTELVKKWNNDCLFRTCSDGTLFPQVCKIVGSDYGAFKQHLAAMCQTDVTLVTASQSPCLPATASTALRVMEKWRLLGLLVGRAILDSRLVDLDMHVSFWSLVQQLLARKELVANAEWLKEVEPSLVASIEAMRHLTPGELVALAIDANTLPGHDDITLGGATGCITADSIEPFAQSVAKAHLLTGVYYQLLVFVEALIEVLPESALAAFSPLEISPLVVGSPTGKAEFWSVESLSPVISAAHGYTDQSQSFKNFIGILSELSEEERILFVKFVTGARSLPANGFAGLKPQLTIVKAVNSTEDGSLDAFLPSVMTCANFVKLPQYSTKEVMKKQLVRAIHECQGSFLLS